MNKVGVKPQPDMILELTPVCLRNLSHNPQHGKQFLKNYDRYVQGGGSTWSSKTQELPS